MRSAHNWLHKHTQKSAALHSPKSGEIVACSSIMRRAHEQPTHPLAVVAGGREALQATRLSSSKADMRLSTWSLMLLGSAGAFALVDVRACSAQLLQPLNQRAVPWTAASTRAAPHQNQLASVQPSSRSLPKLALTAGRHSKVAMAAMPATKPSSSRPRLTFGRIMVAIAVYLLRARLPH